MRSIIHKKNKRGQMQTALIAVVTIFIIGIIIFFTSHVRDELYGALEDNFEDNPDLNATEADIALGKIRTVGQTAWDWAFLAIYIGLMIQMVIFSFASRNNPAFFWIFVIVGIIVLMVGTMLSNVWQKAAENTEFTETIARFPVMNGILGSYFPLVVTGMIFLLLIFVFGKFPGSNNP